MSRLIDADALVDRIIAKVRDTSFFSMIMAEISNVIASLPTVDIVRCKDCKYWAELTFLVPPKHHCGRLLQQYKGISERVSFETDADDFCSRGEKR